MKSRQVPCKPGLTPTDARACKPAIAAVNTLPPDLQGLTTTVTNPDICALGTVISAVSFTVITLALGTVHVLNKRQAAKGSDAGQGNRLTRLSDKGLV